MSAGIIGTAGHIDHGKTALIAALTGVDTDRLPEEKQRGISIDLGFTRLPIGDGELGVVDVPGHEAFIRNMLAGASGIDLLLLVVAADEGVMPQTREHVAIAQLLGIPHAVVALTKTDLVDDEWLALARDDVGSFLADTPFAGAPLVPVSARTGEGIDELTQALASTRLRPRDADDLFRLPVDRTFTVRGTGTVVTGTVWGGRLTGDDALRILPGDVTTRVRGLEVHGHAVGSVHAGQRAAIALAAIDRRTVSRGSILVTDPHWTPSPMLTTVLRVLPATGWSIEQRQRVRVHLGTAEVMARVRLLEVPRIEPGGEAWVQLRLETPLAARAGDRFVVRSYSPVTTIAGGRVVEPAPPRRRRHDPLLSRRYDALRSQDPAAAIAAIVEQGGPEGVPLERLAIECGFPNAAVRAAIDDPSLSVIGDRAFPATVQADLVETFRRGVRTFHDRNPLRPGMDLQELRRLAPRGAHDALVEHALRLILDSGGFTVREGRISTADYRPELTPDQEALRDRILVAVRKAASTPPGLADLRTSLGNPPELEDLVRMLEAEAAIVRLQPDDLLMDADVLGRIAADVRSRLTGRSGLGPADFREVVMVSRKYLIPILEHLDRLGVTVRKGGGREVPPQ